MSKTKGNVVDPLGDHRRVRRRCAPLRAHPRRDARATTSGSAPAKLENARNFANKLWNATRFVVGARPTSIAEDAERRLPDGRPPRARSSAGSLSRAAATTAAVDAAMADYAFGEVTRLLYDAIWNEYCDWGLELAKVRLADESLAAGDARGDLVDARRGPRHVPAAAPSGDAVRDRGAVGGAAAPGVRPGPAHRRPLAGGGGAGRGRRGARSAR